MTYKIIARSVVAAIVAGFAVAAPASPASAASCSITNFTPRDVVIGLSPVKRTFSVAHTCGSTDRMWDLLGGDYDFYAYDEDPSDIFFPPYDNSAEGPVDVVVEAGGSSADHATSYNTSRIFYNGFVYKRRTTLNSFDATPEPVRYGGYVTLRGQLLRANWESGHYDPMGGRYVAVQFRTLDGTYSTVKTVLTDRYGWVNTQITATKSGVWRLQYAGSGVSGAYTTAGDAVYLG